MSFSDSSLSDSTLQILYLGDSEILRDTLLSVLKEGLLNFQFLEFDTSTQLRKRVDGNGKQVIIFSFPMRKTDGLDEIRNLKNQQPDLPIFVISDMISIDKAVEAVRVGANDFFSKNNLNKLIPAIKGELNDPEALQQSEMELSEYELFTEFVLQNKKEHYFADRSTLRILFANPAALAETGYAHAEIRRLKLSDLHSGSDREKLKSAIGTLSEAKELTKTIRSVHGRKDGGTYPVDIDLQLLNVNGVPLLSYTACPRSNQFDKIDLQKDLIKKTEQLALSNEYKSQFLARIGHELRTPLNSINLLSRILLKNRADNLTRDQIKNLHAIAKSGDSLLELINEMLDFSQVEAGEIKIQLEKTSLRKVFSSLKTLFLPVFESKGLKFVTLIEKEIPGILLTDPIRLEQILKNLLSNAGKFTQTGKIKLIAHQSGIDELDKNSGSGKESIAISVIDTGIGIPREKHEMIFEAFRQTDDSTQRTYGGTGLGLSISKELTDLLGGKLTLKSEMGVGSTFTLHLPVDSRTVLDEKSYKLLEPVDHGSQIHTRNLGNTTSLLEGREHHDVSKTILLVDDSKIHASALKELLESKHLTCLIAGTAQETYLTLTSRKIDCVVLDLVLPDSTGFEILNEMKRDKYWRDIPVIIYSAKSLTVLEREQLQEKASAVIMKSSKNFNRLRNAVGDLLED